jgi:hypothetical protein
MSDRLIVLQGFGNPQEAELVRALLESHGIAVFLTDQNIARLGHATPFGGVRVQVGEDDLDEARKILQDTLSEAATAVEETLPEPPGEILEDTLADSEMAVEETLAEPSCPICGGLRSESVSDPVRLLFGVLLAGIPLLVWPRKRRCQICGNVWRG